MLKTFLINSQNTLNNFSSVKCFDSVVILYNNLNFDIYVGLLTGVQFNDKCTVSLRVTLNDKAKPFNHAFISAAVASKDYHSRK